MSKLSFRARALDASKPMPIYLAEELPDLPDYSAINRAVPQMPSGMEKEEESEHHLQRAISGTGLIIPTPEVYEVQDIEFYERCYPPDYKMPKQHIHMQPLWEEQEAPEYDIDSEDERWLKQRRHPELTDLKFEQMMDKLEKSSGQTVVTLNEAKLLLERSDDLVIAVYDYWLNKRLSTQHPLILSVKTEARGGVSTNNPYLAFRRRTEKMQTRKNRKNDESSYEKMLKLRRDLARALTLLELVARREKAKRDLVKLTAALAERRYQAGDFASQLLPDPPPRPQYQPPIPTTTFRREPYTVQHFPPRAPPTPVDQPRQREKRPYKRRKHRQHAAGAPTPRDSGVYTSSEEEPAPRAEEDGPFAFHRKPGCYYEMPTSTLCGDPVDPEDPKSDLFEHEIDERHRYTLTSLRVPYQRCIGFARRRLGRGGRVLLDRVRTPLDDLWPELPQPDHERNERVIQEELATKSFRTPKEISRDYHTSGQYPWRHAFRKHLAKQPHLWLHPEKPPLKYEIEDLKAAADDVKNTSYRNSDHVKMEVDIANVKSDSDVRTISDSDIQCSNRKRVLSECSDSSYDSDESLAPVEREFEKFINEVNTEWLHFRPKTPPPSPPDPKIDDDLVPLSLDTPLTVELRPAENPTTGLHSDTFTTSEFTLGELYPDIPNDIDNSGSSLDISNDDLLNENLGLTEAQMESILSETDLKVLVDDKKMTEDLLDELVLDVGRSGFLSRAGGGGAAGGAGGAGGARGSSSVRLTPLDNDTIYVEKPQPPKPVVSVPVKRPRVRAPPAPAPRAAPPPAPAPPAPAPAPVPRCNIVVDGVNELPAVKLEPQKKRKEDTVEEVHLAHGVQLKTVQTKHSPLKKHIITSVGHRKMAEVNVVTTSKEAPGQQQQPQIVTVAVSDSLKVRLQNHLLASQGGNVVGLVQNGPFTAVALPVHSHSEHGIAVSAGTSTSAAGSAPGRRTAPLLQLAAGSLHKPLQHVPANRLKLLHNRSVGSVVSLGAIQPPALIKPAHPHLATLFDIKGGQLGKGPHLVNVVRGAGKPSVARLELNDNKKRHLVATFDSSHLKGNIAASTAVSAGGGAAAGAGAGGGSGRGRVAVSLEGRALVRAALPAHVRQHLQLQATRAHIHNNKHAVSVGRLNCSSGVSRGVQPVALSAAQLARLAPIHHTEIVEATTAPAAAAPSASESPLESREPEDSTVRRRPADTLPMEVT